MAGFYKHMETSPLQTIVIVFRVRIGLRVAREKEWKKDIPTFTLQSNQWYVCLPPFNK